MPTTYETEGGTSVAAPEEVPFMVDPITGVTINPNYGVDYSNPINNANNMARYEEAFNASLDYAQRASAASMAGIQSWATEMQPFIHGLTAKDNQFNQQQRLEAVEYALPGARQTTLDALGRANTYAQGRLISAIDDRAFESVSRSIAADSTFMRGFGDDSVVGRKTSDILSAKDRLGIAMMGESSLQSWLQLGNQMFVDQPIKANTGAQIPMTPPMDIGAATLQGAQFLGGMNMISAETALGTAQSQATNQAQFDLQTQMHNSGIQLEGFFAEVAAEQSATNALQNAFNQEASMAELQMQQEAQAAGAEDAQKNATTNAAIGAAGTIAGLAAYAWILAL